jgi:tetratricopeptide (TPR) repeat protein
MNIIDDQVRFFKNLDENSIILNYGCINIDTTIQLAKRFNCKVLGVYIHKATKDNILKNKTKNLKLINPAQLRVAILNRLRVDAVVCFDILGYLKDPIKDIALIKAATKKDSFLYMVDTKTTKSNINIYALLVNKFTQINLQNIKDNKFILKLQNNRSNKLPNELDSKIKNAIDLYNDKKYNEAILIYNSLRKKYFIYSEIYNGLGVNYKALKHINKSINAYTRAIQLDPLNSYIYNNLSNAFKSKKQYKKAILAINDAIRANPKNANFYNNLGLLYEQIKLYDYAIKAYKKAVKLNPKFSKAINNIGVLLYETKKYEQSANIFKIVLDVDPTYYEAYSNMGAALNKAKKYDEAIKALETAIEKNPNHSGAYTNLGNVYNKIYEYKKAVKMHEKSIELEPNGSNAYSNLGTSYKQLGYIQKAINSYKKAIQLDPNFVNAHFDLATVYLAKKDFINGFKEYEWRFKKDEMRSHIIKYKDIYSKPKFDGTQDIKDKKLLVHTEQGFGDSIMFVRFVSTLKQKYNCEVILQCRDELKELFEQSIENVDYFYARDQEQNIEFDYQISMLSLPYLYKIDNEKDLNCSYPYLKAQDDEELKIKKSKNKIAIGICWSASVTGDSYDGKVFDLKYLEPLINHPKIDVYSLQVGVEKQDIKKLNYEDKIIDLSDKLTNFNKTASLMKQLDLVISSDTSVAHLAAALDLEVWVPLQKVPDWRWLNKGEKTPWYNSAKLFRQKTARVWDGVFQSIFAKLNKKFKIKIK